MNVYINDKKLEVTVEKEKTLYEVMKPIEEWCNSNGLLISTFSINDEEKSFGIVEENELDIDIENIRDINIYALTYSEYAFTSLVSIIEYIEKMSDIIPETVTTNEINDILNGLMWIIDSLPRTIYLLKINMDDFNIMHVIKMLEVKKEMIEGLIQDGKKNEIIIEFFRNDFKPFLKDKLIPKMSALKRDSEINTLLSISSNIDKNNSLYSIGSMDNFIMFVISILDEITLSLNTGNDKHAFILVEKFSTCITSILRVFHVSVGINLVELKDIKIGDKSLDSLINDFNNSMKNMVDSLANEDYISIADILSYEVKDMLIEMAKYIPVIEAAIERNNT